MTDPIEQIIEGSFLPESVVAERPKRASAENGNIPSLIAYSLTYHEDTDRAYVNPFLLQYQQPDNVLEGSLLVAVVTFWCENAYQLTEEVVRREVIDTINNYTDFWWSVASVGVNPPNVSPYRSLVTVVLTTTWRSESISYASFGVPFMSYVQSIAIMAFKHEDGCVLSAEPKTICRYKEPLSSSELIHAGPYFSEHPSVKAVVASSVDPQPRYSPTYAGSTAYFDQSASLTVVASHPGYPDYFEPVPSWISSISAYEDNDGYESGSNLWVGFEVPSDYRTATALCVSAAGTWMPANAVISGSTTSLIRASAVLHLPKVQVRREFIVEALIEPEVPEERERVFLLPVSAFTVKTTSGSFHRHPRGDLLHAGHTSSSDVRTTVPITIDSIQPSYPGAYFPAGSVLQDVLNEMWEAYSYQTSVISDRTYEAFMTFDAFVRAIVTQSAVAEAILLSSSQAQMLSRSIIITPTSLRASTSVIAEMVLGQAVMGE